MISPKLKVICFIIVVFVITYCSRKAEEDTKGKATSVTEKEKSITLPPKYQTKQPQRATVSARYHGNTRSKIFHSPECPAYDCPNCTEGFMTKRQAKRKGYKPHRCVEPKKYKRKGSTVKKGPP